jgi:hypothetical protein
MNIDDLSHLEDLSEIDSIAGSGALVAVEANASATGDSSYNFARTTARVRELRNGVSIGIGRGTAVAVGEDPIASVSVYGIGDKVIGKTKTKYFPNKDTAIARGFILVIDLP